jgi:hypothetical protein
MGKVGDDALAPHPQAAKLFFQYLQLLLRASRDSDLRAFHCQSAGDGFSDAPAGAGNECILVFELHPVPPKKMYATRAISAIPRNDSFLIL